MPVERAARHLLDCLGVAAPPGADGDELSGLLRDALKERRTLLLLDDAADAEQVDALLPDNPRCLVVAVARGPLTGIPDVRPCTVGGLDVRSAVELLERYAGSVRITVDPQAAEALVELCAGQPAALLLAGGWLAARPTASVADLVKRLRALPGEPASTRPLARTFRLAYEALPAAQARALRLLSLAPLGLADAQVLSALAGCSVSTAGSLLDGLVALGFAREADHGQYEVPGCLMPLTAQRLAAEDRDSEVQLARARMLERTVRLLQSCRAVAEPDGSPPAAASPGCPATCASRTAPRPPSGCGPGSPRCSRPPAWPSPTGSSTPWPAGWSPHSSGPSLRTGAPSPPHPSCTGCTGWSWTWPSGAACTASAPPRC